MTALGKDALHAACRAIYDWAGTDFVLPPLTRGAADGTRAERKLTFAIASNSTFTIAVSLDPAFVDRNTRPHAQLPVSFSFVIRDEHDRSWTPVVEQQCELIGAFLLGVKLPISIEENVAGGQRLLLQLASTYVFDCGEIAGLGDSSECETICDRVSETLEGLSGPFFSSRESGKAVWQIRVRQELFGDPRPPAVVFWPYPELPQANANPFINEPVPAERRSLAMPLAFAASLLLALLAAATLLGNMITREPGEAPSATVAPVRIAVALPVAERVAPSEAPAVENEASKTPDATALGDVGPHEMAQATFSMVVTPAQTLPALVAMAQAPAFSAFAPNDPVRPATKASARAQPVSKSKKPVGISAKIEPKNQFTNPLPGARKAMTNLVHGLERLPTRIAALVKQHTTH